MMTKIGPNWSDLRLGSEHGMRVQAQEIPQLDMNATNLAAGNDSFLMLYDNSVD